VHRGIPVDPTTLNPFWHPDNSAGNEAGAAEGLATRPECGGQSLPENQ